MNGFLTAEPIEGTLTEAREIADALQADAQLLTRISIHSRISAPMSYVKDAIGAEPVQYTLLGELIKRSVLVVQVMQVSD